MSDTIRELTEQKYKYGFVTDVEEDRIRKGLDEDVVRLISSKKQEPGFLLDFRLKAFRHWLTLTEPTWAKVRYNPIDYQQIVYYSAPRPRKKLASMDEVDPEMREAFAKLGIPLEEQKRLSNVGSTRSSTRSRWPPPSRRSWPTWGSSSAPSPTP